MNIELENRFKNVLTTDETELKVSNWECKVPNWEFIFVNKIYSKNVFLLYLDRWLFRTETFSIILSIIALVVSLSIGKYK